MAKKSKGQRSLKKDILRQFERSIDLRRLNYKRHTKEVKYKAILFGTLVAGLLYGAAYAGGYYGFSNNLISVEAFAKIVWIMMIPTTVAGLFTYLIVRNRLEYPLRKEIRDYMEQLERDGGLLWRFTPVWEQFDGSAGTTKKALAWSQEGKVDKLDIEDYCDAAREIYRMLIEHDAKAFKPETAAAVARNFKKQEQAA